MGIKFKQIDNLQQTFDNMSGDFDSRISSNYNSITGIDSGSHSFYGHKYFGNADFSGAQGILVDINNIYTPNNVFAGALSVGYPISTPRNSTSYPAGVSLQVSGGEINFEDQLNIGNNSSIVIDNGSVSANTGNYDVISGGTGKYQYISGSSAEFSGIVMSGDLTGFLKLYDLPDYTQTGSIPSPASGTVFRSGNHLMIV